LIRRSGPGIQLLIASTLLAAGILVAVLLVSSPRDGGSIPSTPERPSPSAVEDAGPSATADATARPSNTGVTPSAISSPPAPTAVPSLPGGELTLAKLLALLHVAPERRQGYDESLFNRWIDEDSDGCKPRREVLISESLTPVAVGPGCSVSGGSWYSAYDALTFTDLADVSIDHVVAMAEAWDSGASRWTPERRERFANDLGVAWTLIAVSPRSNSEKSDKDPADWLPVISSAWCNYIADWLAIKVRWTLAVDQREHDALATLLMQCGATTRPAVLSSATAANPIPTPPVAGSNCEPSYPSVCIPPAPPDLDCADVSFRRFTVLPPDPHRFDGDHDGVGCEG